MNTEEFCNHDLQKYGYEAVGVKHRDRANKQFYINTTSFKKLCSYIFIAAINVSNQRQKTERLLASKVTVCVVELFLTEHQMAPTIP